MAERRPQLPNDLVAAARAQRAAWDAQPPLPQPIETEKIVRERLQTALRWSGPIIEAAKIKGVPPNIVAVRSTFTRTPGRFLANLLSPIAAPKGEVEEHEVDRGWLVIADPSILAGGGGDSSWSIPKDLVTRGMVRGIALFRRGGLAAFNASGEVEGTSEPLKVYVDGTELPASGNPAKLDVIRLTDKTTALPEFMDTWPGQIRGAEMILEGLAAFVAGRELDAQMPPAGGQA